MIDISRNELYSYLINLLPETSESIKKIIFNNVYNKNEYVNALIVYNSSFNIVPQKVNIIYKFLAYVIIIDSLILGDEKNLKEKFSNRGAILLGNSRYIRKRLQSDFGTAYSIRSSIVHNFSLPINDEDFKRYFDNKIENALERIEKYLRLILLRLIKENYQLINLHKIIENQKIFDLKTGYYNDFIDSELKKIFPRSENAKDQVNLDLILGNRNHLVLGIDSVGGFTEKVDIILDESRNFIQDTKRILPPNQVWDEVVNRVKDNIISINNQFLEKITILTKIHLSIIFIVGYYLNFKLQNIYFEFNENLIQLLREYPKRTEEIIEKIIINIDINSSEYYFGFSFSDSIIDIIENKIFPKIHSGSKILFISKMKNLTSTNQIFSLLDIFNQELKKIEKSKKVENLHVIMRIPTPLMFLFGCSIKKSRFKNIILYERGKKEINQEEIYYYPVFVLKNDI